MDPVSRRAVRSAAVVALLVLGASAAFAAGALRPPAPHQVWVSHLLAGFAAGVVGFVVARWWALAGIVLVAAVWYALPQMFSTTVSPEALAQFGSRYPFHLQASALLIPLMVVAGIGAWRNGAGRSLGN